MTDEKTLAPLVPLADVLWKVDSEPTQGQGSPRARFVPYVNGATVAKLLDEWVGPGNWFDEYELGEVAGRPVLWCILSVRIGDDWVAKRDVGVAPNFQAEKGTVSDAFKRVACIKWGVARNVYTLPSLWAPCKVTEKNGKRRAWPSPQTLPALHEELTKLGYDAAGRLDIEGSEDVAGSDDDRRQPAQEPQAARTESSAASPPQQSGREATGSPTTTSAAQSSPPDSSTEDLIGFLTGLDFKDVKKVARQTVIERAKGERVVTSIEHLSDLPDDCLAEIAGKFRQGALV